MSVYYIYVCTNATVENTITYCYVCVVKSKQHFDVVTCLLLEDGVIIFKYITILMNILHIRKSSLVFLKMKL